MSRGHLTGMAGVYYVAAELTMRGFIVSPTSRGAQAADLLVTDEECQRTYSVQVKTNRRTFGFWLMSDKCRRIASDSLFYVFVNLIERNDEKEFFIVPSAIVAAKIVVSPASATRQQTAFSLYRKEILDFKSRWDVFSRS